MFTRRCTLQFAVDVDSLIVVLLLDQACRLFHLFLGLAGLQVLHAGFLLMEGFLDITVYRLSFFKRVYGSGTGQGAVCLFVQDTSKPVLGLFEHPDIFLEFFFVH